MVFYHCMTFNAKYSLYIYIKYIGFGLVWFHGIYIFGFRKTDTTADAANIFRLKVFGTEIKFCFRDTWAKME